MSSQAEISVLLLYIEGTTTPIDFVFKTLFYFAREYAREYLDRQKGSPEVQADLEGLRNEYAADRGQGLNPPGWAAQSNPFTLDAAAGYIEWLIENDRKSRPLKSLEGKIWEAGYKS